MRILNMLAIVGTVLATATVTHALEREPLVMVKTVPQAATLEYRVKGQLLQSLDIVPGVYQISIKQLH